MTYGALFSTKLCADGRFEEAIAKASEEIAADPDEPEAHFNRGQAHAGLARYEEAITDYARALAMDASGSSVDPATIDDELFDAIKNLALASSTDPAAARAIFGRYAELAPAGRHAPDVAKWIDHLEGREVVWVRESAG